MKLQSGGYFCFNKNGIGWWIFIMDYDTFVSGVLCFCTLLGLVEWRSNFLLGGVAQATASQEGNSKMEKWSANDLYISKQLIPDDDVLSTALNSGKQYTTDYEISSTQGQLLYLLAKTKNANRILEVGTFCGYNTIWLEQALPEDGKLISIEYEKAYAKTAQANIENAGLSDKVTILQGNAVDVLKTLIHNNESPFDMIFIDADKPSYPEYLKLSLQLSKSGTIIYGDNVVRDGELCNVNSTDEKVKGVQKFIQEMGKIKTIESTTIQTIGIKRYDGFTLSIVK
ncbi:MAG: O-methyltransferase [Defluviitaleaceae bacterium]|nr:O-methyltransferase [Defluviitaleaceae bacterium]